MSNIEKRLIKLGISLPEKPKPVANYVPGVRTGKLLFTAGLGPANRIDGNIPTGKVGKDLTVQEGYEAARLTGLNALARLKGELGDLDKVTRIIKVLAMVNCTSDFTQQPAVANGFSDLMVEVFGDKGKHARSAVGMNALPNNIPIEIEMIVEVSQ
jgi:enamine deaminase RidA (YjgF/YER057c/UK114 family)